SIRACRVVPLIWTGPSNCLVFHTSHVPSTCMRTCSQSILSSCSQLRITSATGLGRQVSLLSLEHLIVRPPQQRLIGHREYLGDPFELVLHPRPGRRDNNIAGAPLDRHAIDEGISASAHDAEGGVGIGSPAARFLPGLQALNRQSERWHRRGLETNALAEISLGIARRLVKPALDRRMGKTHRRLFDDCLHLLVAVGVRLPSRELQGADQRYVESIDPARCLVAITDMAMPPPPPRPA